MGVPQSALWSIGFVVLFSAILFWSETTKKQLGISIDYARQYTFEAPCKESDNNEGFLVYLRGCEVVAQPDLLASAPSLAAVAPLFMLREGSRLAWQSEVLTLQHVMHTYYTTHCYGMLEEPPNGTAPLAAPSVAPVAASAAAVNASAGGRSRSAGRPSGTFLYSSPRRSSRHCVTDTHHYWTWEHVWVQDDSGQVRPPADMTVVGEPGVSQRAGYALDEGLLGDLEVEVLSPFLTHFAGPALMRPPGGPPLTPSNSYISSNGRALQSWPTGGWAVIGDRRVFFQFWQVPPPPATVSLLAKQAAGVSPVGPRAALVPGSAPGGLDIDWGSLGSPGLQKFLDRKESSRIFWLWWHRIVLFIASTLALLYCSGDVLGAADLSTLAWSASSALGVEAAVLGLAWLSDSVKAAVAYFLVSAAAFWLSSVIMGVGSCPDLGRVLGQRNIVAPKAAEPFLGTEKAPESSPPPVPVNVARDFISALRREYVGHMKGAVGNFYNVAGVSSEMQDALDPFESSVRASWRPQRDIDGLALQWGLQ